VNRRAAFLALSLLLSGGALGVGAACSDFQSAPDDIVSRDAAEANAADAGSDAPSSPCVGAEHFLCADFNEAPHTKNWTEELRTDGGTLGLDPSTSVSPPSSLRASVDELDGGGTGALLMKRVLVTPQQIRLSFALRIDRTARAGANVAAIELGGVPGGDGAYLLISGTDLEATLTLQVVNHADGGLDRVSFLVPTGIPTREWRTVTLLLSLPDAGEQGKLSVEVDGVNVIDTDVIMRAPTQGARASVGLTHFSNVFPAHEVHIDDVVMDVTQ
jgi:hypothetical protein